MRIKGGAPWWKAIQRSKDPTMFTVLFEDSAALLGLLVAIAGVYLAHRFNNPYFDGGASVVIGILLAAVAGLLGYETKGLLIGEGADRETLEDIRRLVESDPGVERLNRSLTMHFGPDTVLLAMDIQFRHNLSAAEVEKTVDRIEANILQHHAEIKHIFIEADSLLPDPEKRHEAN